MVSTNTTDDDGSGESSSKLVAFLTEPLGIGLAAGIAISLVTGYVIL